VYEKRKKIQGLFTLREGIILQKKERTLSLKTDFGIGVFTPENTSGALQVTQGASTTSLRRAI